MEEESALKRFIEAQQSDFEVALKEITNGRKQSHWMWYIFPQVLGLGFSSTSIFYGIKDIQEAAAYLNHPVLGKRLEIISEVLLSLSENNATSIFGSPDDMKLKSSMTLFAVLPESKPVFQKVLDKFFGGKQDAKTLRIIGAARHQP